jgi:hypothetical protein
LFSSTVIVVNKFPAVYFVTKTKNFIFLSICVVSVPKVRQSEETTNDAVEFIRRFSLHILPKGFVRIRHYGILSSTAKKVAAIVIKQQLPEASKPVITRPGPQPYNPNECPSCRKETMQTIMRFNRRGPSADWQQLAKNLLECITKEG